MHNESADNRTRLPFHPCCCGKGWHGAAPGPSSETNDITGCCVYCVYCCGGAAEPVEAWVLVLLATDGLPCSAPGDFGGSSCQGASMGPACLTGWLAYTTLPTLTFYYDGWKAPPKLDSLKGKRGNEKQKMRGQCETWSFGQIYAEGKTLFC